MKKKRLLICFCILVLLIVAGMLAFLLTNKNKESGNNITTQQNKTYEMYVKINPLVKLVFNETFELCTDDSGKEYACGSPENNIVDFELVNNDAKEIYNDLDFYGKTINDVLVMLCDTARDNKIAFDKIDITSDYNNINNNEIMTYLQTHSKYNTLIEINIDIKEFINKDDLLTEEEKNQPKEYAITFNSDGGSKVASQLLKEGEKVTKPKDPTKAGYKFLYWAVDNKEYDFGSDVTSDLKIKAVWELVDESKTTTTTFKQTKESTTAKSTTADKYQSTFEKINLNENILVTEAYSSTMCGSYVYATNFDAIFGNNDTYACDSCTYKTEAELESLFSQLVFDTTKEQAASNNLKAIMNMKKGFSDEKWSSFENHKLQYTFHYLLFGYNAMEGEFTHNRFNDEMNANINDKAWAYEKKIVNTGDYYGGGCGDAPGEPVLLTQELCNEYHLTCDRW